MNSNLYLVPANSKKSLLILGLFNKIDLMVFLTGAFVTGICLILFKLTSLSVIFLVLLPLTIGTVAVIPLPQYHNVMQFLINLINYFSNSRRYYWKGWCIWDEFRANDNEQTNNK